MFINVVQKRKFEKSSRLYLCLLLSISCCTNVFAYFLSDTLFICQSESIQLQSTPNQISYAWTPDIHINNTGIYNPLVQPEVTTIYYVTVEPGENENLVANGDFSQGNTGFQSDYNLTTTGTFQQGFYGIFTSPTQFNSGFGNCQDHSNSADGLMFVADGATIPDENVWCQTIANILPGRTYQFSAWITNVHPTAPSTLQFSINGSLLGQPFDVSQMVCEWVEFAEDWYAQNATSATICITNQSTIAFGNDFAIDDISFKLAPAPFVDTFTVIVLEHTLTQIDTSICANEVIWIDNEPVPADTQSIFTYTSWNGCDSIVELNVTAIDTSLFQTIVDTLCPGDTIYYLGIEITQDTSICNVFTNVLGCDSAICFVAYFLSEATIAVASTMPSCTGAADGELNVRPFAGLPPYQYAWSTGSTTAMLSNLSAAIYELTVTDIKGCIATKTIELQEPPPLAVSAVTVEPSCFGELDGQLMLSPTGGTPGYQLSFTSTIIETNTILTNLAANSYPVIVKDANDCLLDTVIILGQPKPLVVALPADTSLALGCTLDLHAQIFSDHAYEILWTPSTGLNCVKCESPQMFAQEAISYQVRVTDSSGCKASDSIHISIIKDYKLFIPNIFTPNGDGINDYFEIFPGKDVEEILSLSIYDRWGALLFHKTNMFPHDPTCRWDGMHHSQNLPPGVFVYVAKVRFLDGHEKTFSGDVLLMK